MKIKKIRILSLPEKFGGRVVEVQNTKRNFTTPTRSATSTEANYKDRLNLDAPILNPLLEIVKLFTKKYPVKRFREQNGVFYKSKREITARTDAFEYAISKFFPQLEQTELLSIEDVKIVLDLQIESGADVVSIPDITTNSDFAGFERHVIAAAEYIRECSPNLEPMPYIDLSLKHSDFKGKFDVILANINTFSCVGFIHRSVDKYRANYSYIWKHRDKEIWTHVSGVPRVLATTFPTSQLHIPQRYGIDTCALKLPRIPPPPTGEKSPPERVLSDPTEYLRFFDRQTIELFHLPDWHNRYGNDISCNCAVCSDKNLNEFIEAYLYDKKGKVSQPHLIAATKMHELFASTNEFEASQRYIRENSLGEYFTEKEGLSRYAKEAFET